MTTIVIARGRKNRNSQENDPNNFQGQRSNSICSSEEAGGVGYAGGPSAASVASDGDRTGISVSQGDNRPADLSVRDRIWLSLDDPSYSRGAYWWSISILTLILLSCTAFVVETVPSMCCGRHDSVWDAIEYVCVGAFTVEYLGRFLVCPAWMSNRTGDFLRCEEESGVKAEVLCRLRYFWKPLNLIDFAAIVPFYITLGVGGSGGTTAFLRVIRLARVFRLFKLSKYSEGMVLLSSTMIRSWRALGMLGFFMLISVVVFSSIMYFVERGEYFYCTQAAADQGLCSEEDVVESRTEGQGLEQCSKWIAERYLSSQDALKCCWGEAWYVPFDFNGDGCADKSQYDSILQTAWWCVVTMTTVGYGDVVPLTTEGKLVATLTMLGGILILALPITVIGSNFNIEYDNREMAKRNHEDLASADAGSEIMAPPMEPTGRPDNPDLQRFQSRASLSVGENQSALLLAMEKIMADQRETVLKKAEEMMAQHIREIAREVVANSLAAQQHSGAHPEPAERLMS